MLWGVPKISRVFVLTKVSYERTVGENFSVCRVCTLVSDMKLYSSGDKRSPITIRVIPNVIDQERQSSFKIYDI